jgi:hypothetical protein
VSYSSIKLMSKAFGCSEEKNAGKILRVRYETEHCSCNCSRSLNCVKPRNCQASPLLNFLLSCSSISILSSHTLMFFRVYRASHRKSDTENSVESGSFKRLPQNIKMISCKQSRSGTILSPSSDVRNSYCRQEYSTRSSPLGSSKSASNGMTDPSMGKLPSSRMVSFHEEKDVIKIEES